MRQELHHTCMMENSVRLRNLTAADNGVFGPFNGHIMPASQEKMKLIIIRGRSRLARPVIFLLRRHM